MAVTIAKWSFPGETDCDKMGHQRLPLSDSMTAFRGSLHITWVQYSVYTIQR